MYGLKVYITPEDIIDKLSDDDKERFNQCVFTDVIKEKDGSITIDCVLFNDSDSYVEMQHRQKYFCNDNTFLVGNFEQSYCVNCPSNPKNGGDGICFCTLGQQVTY